MVTDKLFQSVKDSLGLVIDRTIESEKVLGQASLIGKSRVAVCASTVFNYVDFPYALSVSFPYAGLVYSCKQILLHPNFDTKKAQAVYQSQGMRAIPEEILFDYDLATLVLEESSRDISQDEISRINAALSMSVTSQGSDIFGELLKGQLPQVLQSALAYGVDGLLTICDSRNCPLARISVGQGRIKRVLFGNLIGDMALFELIFRAPTGRFVFQAPDPLTWPSCPELTAQPAQLVAEAQKRASQLPGLLNSLGGANCAYQRSAVPFEAQRLSPQLAWVEEIIWTQLDGYLTLDRLSQRVGADTYSIICGLKEMVNLGFVQMVTTNPFRRLEKTGPPLMPRPDLNVWDNLSGVLLDPLSGKFIGEDGNFFGAASPKDPKILLHTVSLPNYAKGAAMLKDNLMTGIHSGAFVPGPEQQQLPGKLYQMIWVGALQDISGRTREAASEEGGEFASQQDTQSQRQMRSTRTGTLICPNCQAPNYEPGKCVSCGTEIKAPLPETEGAAETHHASKISSQLRNAPTFSGIGKKQILIAAAGLLVLSIILMYIGTRPSPKPKPEAAPTASPKTESSATPAEGETKPDSDMAASIAKSDALFKGSHPPGYWFEDTSQLTNGMPSFGIYSAQHDQKVLVVVWDNDTPANNLDVLLHKVPYTDLEETQRLDMVQVERGDYMVAGTPMKWFVGRYQRSKDKDQNKDNTEEMVLVGAYTLPAPGAKKAVVVIAQPYHEDTKIYDYRTALWLLDTMASPAQSQPAAETKPESEEKKEVTEADIEAYRKEVESTIKGKYSMPEDGKKLKVTIDFGISEEGKLSKMEITAPSNNDNFDQAAIKALTAGEPYSKPPGGKPTSLKLSVAGAKVTVDHD